MSKRAVRQFRLLLSIVLALAIGLAATTPRPADAPRAIVIAGIEIPICAAPGSGERDDRAAHRGCDACVLCHAVRVAAEPAIALPERIARLIDPPMVESDAVAAPAPQRPYLPRGPPRAVIA